MMTNMHRRQRIDEAALNRQLATYAAEAGVTFEVARERYDQIASNLGRMVAQNIPVLDVYGDEDGREDLLPFGGNFYN